jgi:hypothetical protein
MLDKVGELLCCIIVLSIAVPSFLKLATTALSQRR